MYYRIYTITDFMQPGHIFGHDTPSTLAHDLRNIILVLIEMELAV
jgi:hypothetical protein